MRADKWELYVKLRADQKEELNIADIWHLNVIVSQSSQHEWRVALYRFF